MANQYSIKHGMSSKSSVDPTYRSWCAMKARCANKNDKNYPRYGGRGISFCERWNDFENFLVDMGVRPDDTSLDRINNNGNYEPGNCRWATRKEQMNNQSTTVFIECFGKRQPLSEWSKETGLSRDTILRRLRSGLSPEVTLSSPAARGYVISLSKNTLDGFERKRVMRRFAAIDAAMQKGE